MFAMPLAIADMHQWANRWDPADKEFRSRVWGLGPVEGNAFDTVQREFVSFVNPHLSVSRDRLVQELNENISGHWLRGLNADPTLVAAATEAVTELLFNLSAHPFGSIVNRPGATRDVPLDRRFALLTMYTTSGGGGDRLHIVVFDTGHGIPRTLRPKFSKKQQAAIGSDRSLIEMMLSSKLPPYGRGEGRGFPRLVELANRHNGSLHLITSANDDLSATVIGQVLPDEELPTVTTQPRFDLLGTIVRVTLGFKRLPNPVQTDGEPLTFGDVAS
jgi:hypothetical protein